MTRFPCSDASGKGGLTLLELLLATALVSVAALVVAQAFAAGFRVWQRASQLSGNYADTVIALESLHRDVRNARPCRLCAFRGGPTWLEIPSLLPGGDPQSAGDQPGRVRYEFERAGAKLDRIISPCVEGEPAGVVRRETLAGGVVGLAFHYAERVEGGQTALSWTPAWEGRTNTPAAVKVVWSGKQGVEQFEFERTISVPVR